MQGLLCQPLWLSDQVSDLEDYGWGENSRKDQKCSQHLLMAMFVLASESQDVDIIHHQSADPRIITIKAQIELLRQKTIQIGGPEKIVEFNYTSIWR